MTIGELDGRAVAVQDGLALVMILGRMEPYDDGWCVIEPSKETRWVLAEGSELMVQVTKEAEEVRCMLTRDERGWYLMDVRTLFIRDELDGLIVRALYLPAKE